MQEKWHISPNKSEILTKIADFLTNTHTTMYIPVIKPHSLPRLPDRRRDITPAALPLMGQQFTYKNEAAQQTC